MHPAYSVIIFTTLSGAGYGLLAWLALSVLWTPILPTGMVSGLVAFGLAFAVISVGLVSSTLHLGRPERAWRAFSQWRTSWLSREGVLAVSVYPVGGLFAAFWIFDPTSQLLGALAALTAVLAMLTVYCTAMIYASLPTVRAWHQPHVAPIYMVLSLLTGGAVAMLLGAVMVGQIPLPAAVLELVLAGIGLGLKSAYWDLVDNGPRRLTAGAATGLGKFGQVRPLDPPHSRPNFVMREMGYVICRKHAAKLRRLVMIALFAIPAASMALTLVVSGSWIVLPLAAGVLGAGIGVLAERWLFFAEAQHAVTLFYGSDVA